MSQKSKISRRGFLRNSAKVAASAAAFPYFVPASALGKNGTVAPSNRITLGCIGVGWMGTENLRSFLNEEMAQVVAVCDIDRNHLENARNGVNNRYGNKDCATYHKFEELLSRDDIDAVSLGLPDHWHSIPAIMAANAGKDIYAEKPLSHTLIEGRAMCDAVERHKRVWQTGSWQRSRSNFRFACELVLNGKIGRVHTAEVGLPSGHADFSGKANQTQIEEPPANIDYQRWIGPAPYHPYRAATLHKNWRWVLDFGGGQLMDWIGHHVDIAHWGLGLDYAAPVEVEATGDYPDTGVYDSPTRYRVNTKYANGLKMIIAGGYGDIRSGTKWIGDEGWVWVNRGGRIEAEPQSILEENIGPNDINLLHSPGHHRNFLNCVKTRATTLATCEIAHHSATPGHLGRIAMELNRKIRFDPDTEEIIDDPTANSLLGNAMRNGWHL